MSRIREESTRKDNLSAKVIDFRLWQRKKLQQLIRKHQLTDCLILAERLGYPGQWGIDLIRNLQNQEVA